MKPAASRKVSFKSVGTMGGKRKSGDSSSEDEASLAKPEDHAEDRDPSRLQDLLEKSETASQGSDEDIKLVSKRNRKHIGVTKVVDETTKNAIPLERLDSHESCEGEYSFHDLAREGNAASLARLVQKLAGNEELIKKAVNEPDEEKFTPLHYATRYNHHQAAKILVDHGADVTATAEGDITPLHYCARYKLPPLSTRLKTRTGSGNAQKKVRIKEDPELGKRKSIIDYEWDNTESDDYYTCRQSLLDSGRQSSQFSPNHAPGNLSLPASRLDTFEEEPALQTVLIISLLIKHGANINAVDKAGQSPLHYAASQGNETFVVELLRWDPEINATDRQFQTPLHAAASTDSVMVCRHLIEAGAAIDCRDYEEKTPLHIASQFGKAQIARLLLDQIDPTDETAKRMRFGQFIDARDLEGNTALLLAVENRSYSIAELLIKRGADVNAARKSKTRCLHLASKNGDVAIIDLLVLYGAKLDCQNSEIQTPLHLACAKNKEQSAQHLIEKGADVRVKDRQGRTPLLTAAVAGSLACLKCIMKKSLWAVDDSDKYDRTALFLAAKYNRLEIVKYLISGNDDGTITTSTDKTEESDPDVTVCYLSDNAWVIGRDQMEYPDRHNNTPLHIAALKGYYEIVEYLLSAGAIVDARNENEKTPMHLAAEEGCVRVVRLLAETEESRKTIFEQDEDANTPLHLAAKRGNALVAKTLLEFGSDVKVRNSRHWTPLHYAVDCGWTTTTSILLEHKSPVNMVDKTQTSALHMGCKGGHVDIVTMLLERKADVRALDCDNKNCLDWAIQNEHRQVIVVLISHDQWRSMLTHAYMDPELKQRQTPLRALIKTFPDVAKMVFEKCSKPSRLPPEHPQYEVTYDYELLEDTYSRWEPDNPGIASYDEKHHLRPHARPYAENSTEVKRNHPLMIMVLREREDLLDHPLARNLLKHKWRTYGRYVYYSVLLIYLLFLAALTAYVATARPPYFTSQTTPLVLDEQLEKKDFCARVLENGTSAQRMVLDFAFSEHSTRVLAIKYLILVLAILSILKEGVQLYLRRLKYFTFENCIELFIYVAGFVFVIDFTPCSRITGYRMDWQWQLGAFAVFLAWFNLMLFASKLPRFGIYVVMFIDVSRTFSQFFLLYFLFIVAFALCFFALFQNQHPFSTIGSSIVKTMVMMVGEYDYEGIFTPVDESYGEQVFYYRASNIFFALFVVVMTILVMNLLIGLAVDDIKSIQQQAMLKRLALQVEQVMEVEQLVPERFRRRWMICQETVYPNRQLGLRWLAAKLFAFMGFPAAVARRAPGTRTNVEKKLADRKMRALMEATNNKLDQLIRTMETMQKEQNRLKKLVMSLSERSRNEAGTREEEEEWGPLF